MEPIIQTSRLRLAISSVQTFIQRCFMNLEDEVQPSILDADQWQWMKRYRIWQANREIFLFPENWLEQEFRDDKTELCQEFEGALLQGDISNELAEGALFTYLKKLEEIARLEIVSIYDEEPMNPATHKLHVVGRTATLPQRYFYRHFANGMWTPWESITTEIDGDHVVAVVWRNRVNLFWVTFLEKPNQDTSGAPIEIDPTQKIRTASDVPYKDIQVQLNWCEYFQGQWTVRGSSGFGDPLIVVVDSSFSQSSVFAHATVGIEDGVEVAKVHLHFDAAYTAAAKAKAQEETKVIQHDTDEADRIEKLAETVEHNAADVADKLSAVDDAAGLIALEKGMAAAEASSLRRGIHKPRKRHRYAAPLDIAFRVSSKNVLPEKIPGAPPAHPPYTHMAFSTTHYTGSTPLQVTHVESTHVRGHAPKVTTATQNILGHGMSHSLITGSDNFSLTVCGAPTHRDKPEIGVLMNPFFCQDNHHLFYVEPSLLEAPVHQWAHWAVPHPKAGSTGRGTPDPNKPRIVASVPRHKPPHILPPVGQRFAGLIDRGARFHIQARVDSITEEHATVQYGAHAVGKMGGLGAVQSSEAGRAFSTGRRECTWGQPMSFHSYYDAHVRRFQTHHATKGWISHHASKQTKGEDTHLTYSFHLHEHPYVTELVNRLVKTSVKGLQDADTEYQTKPDGSPEPLKNAAGRVQTRSDGTPIPRPHLYKELFSHTSYTPSGLVGHPYPVMDLDFTSSGAYSVYNWELFYHLPMGVAIQLSKNQCYEQAQRWFHYVFDPTDNSHGPTPERFWKVKPFQHTDAKMVEEVLVNLSTATNSGLHQETINSIEAWKHDPFRPFLVARYRQSAFMFKAVTAYLDNLVAWGDSLFSQYTGETINEAAQIYILAANILGPRPQAVPKKGSEGPQTYASLRSRLDEFGNALVDLETEVPFDLGPHPNKAAGTGMLNTVNSIGKSLYFCVPRNEKLLGYWDMVADRLFKIRNSLNIQGVFQRVPLFEPPIDPALLARGVAEGLDVGAIVSGLNQPMPLVRFQYLLQRATEMCQEVKSLGNNLLAAIEKKDNEALAILRAKHETCILQLAESVKYSAWQEAIKNREGLEQSITNAKARYTYYERLLGKQPSEIDNQIPSMDPLDAVGLASMKFHAKEEGPTLRTIDIDIAQDLGVSGGKNISSHEAEEMDTSNQAKNVQIGVQVGKGLAAGLRPIPEIRAPLPFLGDGR